MFVRTLSLLTLLIYSVEAAPVVEKASYDFGSVYQGETVEAIFKIQNKGETPISIHKITAPCGCTATSGEGAIAPGESKDINVKVSTELFTGSITKTATVLTSDLATPEIVLSVTGEVKSVGTISPEVINFGVLDQGETYKTRLKASSSGAFKLSGINSASQYIKMSDSGEVSISPPIGEFRDRILVTFKSPEKTIVKNVPVYGRVQASTRAEPPVVSFGVVTAPVTRNVKIFTKSPIESIQSNEVEVAQNDDASLTFSLKELTKDLKTVVSLSFQDGQRLDIPVYGVSP